MSANESYKQNRMYNLILETQQLGSNRLCVSQAFITPTIQRDLEENNYILNWIDELNLIEITWGKAITYTCTECTINYQENTEHAEAIKKTEKCITCLISENYQIQLDPYEFKPQRRKQRNENR